MLKKFTKNDVFRNQIKAYPEVELHANNGVVYYNKEKDRYGVTNGSVNLQEASGTIGNQFITKDGTLSYFGTMTTSEHNSQFSYGDTLTASANLESSVESRYYAASEARTHITSLRNTLNHYRPISSHYEYTGDHGDKSTQILRMISIPSIMYGSKIEKGSVSLKFYLTGTLIAELQDNTKNGELIEVTGSNTGSVAGVVLYREGFVVLTGSWNLHDTHTENYVPLTTSSVAPAWKHFMTTGSNGIDLVPSSSFSMTYKGISKIPVLTMMCHAKSGELNHSNNPTYIEYGQEAKLTPFSGTSEYRERDDIAIKNLVKVDYVEEDPKFEKVTYISKVAIYDEERNLVGIAKLATPVRKRETEDYTFKLKLDI